MVISGGRRGKGEGKKGEILGIDNGKLLHAFVIISKWMHIDNVYNIYIENYDTLMIKENL